MNPRQSGPEDVYAGAVLKRRRVELGWSQDKLGRAVGVSFQMIQKYERGECRMGNGRLQQMAKVLDMPSDWFVMAQVADRPRAIAAEDTVELDETLLHSRETVMLLKAYYSLPVELRPQALQTLQKLADEQAPRAPNTLTTDR